MDIITHTLSGLLVGVTVSSYTNSTKSKATTIIAGAIGGCLPDIDAISLWSGFDGTFGKIFGIDHYGHDIYFSKLWYSHHGFFHSIAAIVFYLLLYLLGKKVTAIITLEQTKINLHGCVAFSGGYLAHILEDLPTPSGSWGGVNMFWPSEKWVGGTGHTWWWNNYDIFLIVLVSGVISLILTFSYTKWSKNLSIMTLLIAIILIVFQIKSRDFDFNSNGYGAKESKSLDIQKKILGDKIFNIMTKMDDKIKINF